MRRASRKTQLLLERLEDRCLLNFSCTWIGTANSNWSNIQNWSGAGPTGRPETGDDVTLTGTPTFDPLTNVLPGGYATQLGKLAITNFGGHALHLSYVALTFNGASTMDSGDIEGPKFLTIAGPTFSWTGGKIASGGSLILGSSTTTTITPTNSNFPVAIVGV